MASIDFTNVLQIAATFTAVVVPLAAAWVSKEVTSLLRIKSDSAQADTIRKAVNTGATLIVNGLHAAAVSPADVTVPVKSATLADAVQHVLDSVPDALDKLGVKPATVANLVQAEVARLTKENETTAAVVAAGHAAIQAAATK